MRLLTRWTGILILCSLAQLQIAAVLRRATARLDRNKNGRAVARL
jgi:hypothetical protein